MNEEPQSFREDSEPSKEALQSLIEELSTANIQLKDQLAELESNHNDLTNLLASAHLPALVVDRNLRIKRLTPTCGQLSELTPTDLGRSVDEIVDRIQDSEFAADLRQVLATLSPIEREVHAKKGEYYLKRIFPFLTVNGEVDGVAVTYTDINAVKIALAESEEQLSKLAETVPGVVCSFRLRPDGSTSMPFASPAVEETYGLPADVLAEDFSVVFKRIHPDDLDHVNASIEASARSMTHWRDSFRFQHPVKGEIWIEGHSVPLREPDGSLLWHGFIQDVTGRILKEREISSLNQKLQRQMDDLRVVFDTVPIGLSIAEGSDRMHIRGNAAIYRILGLPVNSELSLRSKHCAPYRVRQSGQNMDESESPMQRAIRGESVTGQVFEAIRPDGSVVDLISNVAPLCDSQGQPRGAVGAFMDITDQKCAEAALNRSEQFKQAVLDALPASIAVLDNRGVIIAVNRPWSCFADRNEAPEGVRVGVGLNYLDTCRQAIRTDCGFAEQALEGIQSVLGGQRSFFEMEYPCPTPKCEFWFMMQVVQPSGEVGGAIVVHIDITNRKQAESEIARHLESLKVAYSELERFNRAAVGRELRMIELKQQVNELCHRLGQAPRYRVDLDAADSALQRQ